MKTTRALFTALALACHALIARAQTASDWMALVASGRE